MHRTIMITAIAGASLLAVSAFAVDMSQVQKSIEIKDGSMVYIFKDGKMGWRIRTGTPLA